jgi:hypothetical protein
LSVSIGISVTFFILSKLREAITSGMGCEILFRKPKRIKDLVNLGVRKARLLIILLLQNTKKQYIEREKRLKGKAPAEK